MSPSSEQTLTSQRHVAVRTRLRHDFNILITSLNGFANILLTRLAPDDPARPCVEQIRKAGTRAAMLVNSLSPLSDAPLSSPSPHPTTTAQ